MSSKKRAAYWYLGDDGAPRLDHLNPGPQDKWLKGGHYEEPGSDGSHATSWADQPELGWSGLLGFYTVAVCREVVGSCSSVFNLIKQQILRATEKH